MTVLYPEATQAFGMTSVVVVQELADTTTPIAPSLAGDVNAASSVNASCFLYGGGVGTANTNKGEAPRRICTRRTVQQFGATTYEISDLQYTYNPQAPLTHPDNKARAALAEGTEVWLLVRRGLDAQDDPFAVDQIVDLWHVRLGPQNKTQTGDGEFDEFSITQSVIALEPPVEDVAIAA